ncbi:twin-arginine translocase subunit TatC [Pelagicoccus sp. SDUM812003]|uniref:twin-arginine translocase subunit TatC n=1 Tax=Pelagicoccus sp. SDUM812003 TaxID=3041267 RepID=UPI00280D6BF2|nr:twin-arginine translocase subunit TatC [Pelagicoccus sp. SDUM812003]MDQ8203164.1 twin-arginine translocase subunit TatC [Pelagicoccus sp. SDUM812003]
MSDIVPKDVDNDEEQADWAGDPKQMGFLDHLEELRWTLIKPLAVFFLSFIASMIFIQDVKEILMYPLNQNYSVDEIRAFAGLATRNITGVYTAMLHIGLIVGIGVSSPFFLYNMAKFLAPALTKREKRLLIPGSVSVLFLFLLGCCFSFFLLLPKAIQITMQFNEMLGFQIIWSPESYFGFITWIVIGMGVAFQFPLIAIVLVYLDILTVEKLRSFRRVAIISFFIAAAVLTPPDPVTQIMMAIPMMVLYEVAIFVSRFVVKRRIRAEEAWENEDV